jgi:NAD(P)-dependent dehydrogenase (short-subunit alcohol dehydrogenase family)
MSVATSGLRGKVVVVTGAGSGIGRKTCEAMAAEGARLVAVDLDLERARETCLAIGDGAIAVEMDVSNKKDVQQGITNILESMTAIDVVVNNAGVSIPGAVHEISEETWDAGIATNLKSVYLVSNVVWPSLQERRGGAIVNVASISGIWAGPSDATYCASKAGVIMLTKCMALDGASSGIRVNCVCPGWIDTPMVERIFNRSGRPEQMRHAAQRLHPLGCLGETEDIANAIVYLASDEAKWVTGCVLVVDGGMTCGLHPQWMD